MNKGEVAIEVVLGTKKFDKQYAKLESKLKKEDLELNVKHEDADVILKKLKEQEAELERLKQKQKQVTKEYNSFFKEFNELDKKRYAGGSFSAAEAMRLDSLDKEKDSMISEQQEINNAVQKQANIVEELNIKHNKALTKIEKQEIKVKETKEQMTQLKDEAEQYKNEMEQITKQNKIDNVKNSLKNVSNETTNIIRKIAKWGLAIFSIRSAYMMVRQAVSSLSQYDKQIGTDIEYIRFIIANELKPIIEGIIKLVYTLLTYIAYIAKAWFGVTLFANSSAKAFQKVNKGVKDTNKSAQKLQKTLAGFDEMNILQENGTTSTGGGGGGITAPSVDLSEWENVKIPEWIDVIAQNGKLVKDLIIGIAEAFLMWKMVKWASELGLLTTNFKSLSSILQTAGIIVFIMGIVNAIGDLINYIIDPSWDNFKKLVGDLSIALMGLSGVLIAINASNPIGWIGLAVGAIGTFISNIYDASDANEDLAKKTKTVAQAEEDLENAREARINSAKKYAQAIKEEESSLKKLNKLQKDTGISGKELHQEILLGTKNYKELSPKQREVYDAYLDHLSAEQKLKTATDEFNTSIYDEKKATESLTGAVYNEKRAYDDYFNTLITKYREHKIEAGEMADAMKTAMNEMSDTARREFINNLPDDIRDAFNHSFDGVKNAADGTTIDLEKTYIHFKDGMEYSYKELGDTTKKFELDSQKMSSGFSKTWTNASKNIQGAIDKLKSFTKILEKLPFGKTLSMKINTLISGSGNAKGAIYYPPKLAVGGIINQPGRGVPLAMGGERGAEGVIPLTDIQQMQRLGEAIGKYITVNANIVNTMNGRVISRELKQIENDENFAFNGG